MPSSLAVTALDLVLISPPPGLILAFSSCVGISVTTLSLGSWAIATGILIGLSLTPVRSLSLGFIQSSLIIHGIVKFGTNCLMEGFPKAIEYDP